MKSSVLLLIPEISSKFLARSSLSTAGGVVSTGLAGIRFSGASCGIEML